MDPSQLPTMSGAMAPTPSAEWGDYLLKQQQVQQQQVAQANRPSAFMGGVYEGVHSLLGGVGSLGAAIGNVSGNKWLQEGGQNIAAQQQDLSKKWGRQDLDTAPWQEGGGGWSKALPWLAHGAGAMVPTMAAVLGGSALGAAAAPAVGVGAGVGGLIGGAAMMYPGAVGGLYDAAAASPEGPTPGKSAAALVAGVPLAGLMALGPETSAAIVGRGPLAGAAPALEKAMQGKIAQRVVTGAATQAAVGAVQGGAQTGAEMMFRSDLKPEQQMQAVVDATTSGAVMGGIIGGVAGIHKMKVAQDAPPDDMKGKIDAVLKPGDQPALPGIPAAVDAQGPVRPEYKAPVPEGPVAQGELALEGGSARTPEQDAQRIAQQTAMRQSLLDIYGSDKKGVPKASNEAVALANSLEATTRPEMIAELRGRVDAMGNDPNISATGIPKWMQPALKALKIIDDKGSTTETGPDGVQVPIDRARKEAEAAQAKYNVMRTKLEAMQDDRTNTTSTFVEKKKFAEQTKAYRENVLLPAKQMWYDHQEAEGIVAKREAEPKVTPRVDPESLWAVAKTPADEEAANILTRKAQGKGFFDTDETPITDAAQQQEQTRFDQTGGLPRPGEGEQFRPGQGGELSSIPPESQTGMVDPAMAALYPGSMDSMVKTTPSPMKSVLHPSILKDWEDYAKLHADARLLGNSRTIQGAGKLGPKEQTNPGTPGRMPLPLVSGASIEVGDWSGLRRNFPTPTTPALPVNRTGLSQAAQGWNAKFGNIKSIAATAVHSEAGPKAVGEFGTVIGQLKAILAKESDRDGQAYSEKTRADAQAALWAVSQGDAGPANKLLSSPVMNYRATVDREGQYDGSPRNQEEAKRRAQERIDTDAKIAEKEAVDREAGKSRQAAQVVAAAPSMPDPEFQTAFVKAVSALGEMNPGAQQSFKIIGTAGELPKEVLADMVARKVNPNLVRGTMVQNPDGTVSRYIIRDRMKSAADVQEVVAHEYVHGQTGDFVLVQIYDRAKGLHTLLEAARQKGVLEELKEVIPRLKETLDKVENPNDPKQMAAAIKEVEEQLTFEDKADVVDELLALVGGKRAGKDNNNFFKQWGTTIREGFVETLKLLGLSDYAKKVDAFNAIGALQALRDMRGIEPDTSPTGIRQKVMYNRTPQAADDKLGEAMRVAIGVKDALGKAIDLSDFAQKVKLFWNTNGSFYKEYGHYFPSAKELDIAGERKGMMNTFLLMPGKNVLEGIISKLDPKGIGFLHEAMRASYSRIDASKPWEAQPWLHNLPNRDELQRLTGEANQAYNQLGQKGGQDAFKQAALVGQWQQLAAMATQLHYLMTDQYGHTGPNPIDLYHDSTAIHGKLAESHQFMQQQVNDLLSQADVLSARKSAENPTKNEKTSSPTSRRMGKIIPIDDLRQLIGYVKGAIEGFNEAPYFKMGRVGDYYVAAKLRKLEDGRVDPAAIAAMEKLKNDAGFTGIDMNAGAQTNAFYSRFETPAQMDAFNAVIAKARDAGLLDSTSKNDDGVVDHGISSGRATQPNTIKAMAPSWMQGMLARIDADGTLPQGVRDQIKNLWLDMIPDNSLSKSYQPREGVHGASADILRSMGDHNANFANALAGSVTASHQRPAIGKMARDLEAMHRDPMRSTQDKLTAANVLQEIVRRQEGSPWRIERGLQDALIALNHVYALGLSPGYMLEVMSQIPTLLWPTLSQKSGYVQSAKAIASVTPEASKVMKAIFAGKDRMSGVATEDILRAGGISEPTIKKLMGAVVRGDLYTFTQSAVKETGGKEPVWQRAARFANITAVYGELFSRVISTLAAHKLYEASGGKGMGGMDAHEYAHYVNDKAMMRWDQGNAPRATTKAGGIAGQLSPVMTRFMGYQIRMLETLYRDTRTALEMDAQNKYSSAAERKQAVTEARRFLAGHLGAATVLAGTMGLPAAVWMAGAAARLTGGLPGTVLPGSLNPTGISWDVQEAYRDFLTHIFGKTGGEVLTHGVPRALGFDMSQNFGDDRLLPFTDLIKDRRKIEDSAPDWAANMFGSPFSMITNFVKGARNLGTGNVLQGLKEMAPTSLKSAIEAYRMTEHGYVDNAGHPMPLTANARDILAQAVGFTPAKKAEYQEQQRANTGRVEDIQFRSGVLKRNLAMAVQKGDRGAQQAALAAIQEHDAAIPQLAIGPELTSYLTNWFKAPELSKATGLPVGANLRDYIHNQQSREIYNW